MSTMLKFLTKSVTCPFPRPATPDLSHPTALCRTSLPLFLPSPTLTGTLSQQQRHPNPHIDRTPYLNCIATSAASRATATNTFPDHCHNHCHRHTRILILQAIVITTHDTPGVCKITSCGDKANTALHSLTQGSVTGIMCKFNYYLYMNSQFIIEMKLDSQLNCLQQDVDRGTRSGDSPACSLPPCPCRYFPRPDEEHAASHTPKRSRSDRAM